MTRFVLLSKYGAGAPAAPMDEWDPADVEAHMGFLRALNQELIASGELVDAQGLAGPEGARFVSCDAVGAPVVTDGPFPESKEFLAGYQMIDVASEERAIEIAARLAGAPGPGGAPIRQEIEVRRVMGRLPGADDL